MFSKNSLKSDLVWLESNKKHTTSQLKRKRGSQEATTSSIDQFETHTHTIAKVCWTRQTGIKTRSKQQQALLSSAAAAKSCFCVNKLPPRMLLWTLLYHHPPVMQPQGAKLRVSINFSCKYRQTKCIVTSSARQKPVFGSRSIVGHPSSSTTKFDCLLILLLLLFNDSKPTESKTKTQVLLVANQRSSQNFVQVVR